MSVHVAGRGGTLQSHYLVHHLTMLPSTASRTLNIMNKILLVLGHVLLHNVEAGLDCYKGVCTMVDSAEDHDPEDVQHLNVELSEILEWGAMSDTFDDVPRNPEILYIVPKNIHFIWLGSRLPDKYLENISTYRYVRCAY